MIKILLLMVVALQQDLVGIPNPKCSSDARGGA